MPYPFRRDFCIKISFIALGCFWAAIDIVGKKIHIYCMLILIRIRWRCRFLYFFFCNLCCFKCILSAGKSRNIADCTVLELNLMKCAAISDYIRLQNCYFVVLDDHCNRTTVWWILINRHTFYSRLDISRITRLKISSRHVCAK